MQKLAISAALATIAISTGSDSLASTNPLLGRWKVFRSYGEQESGSPIKTALTESERVSEIVRKSDWTVIEFTETKALIDGKEICASGPEYYEERGDDREYDKEKAKDTFWQKRMNPEKDMGQLMQICKRKGRKVDVREFFDLEEWVATCGEKGVKPGINAILADSMYRIDEYTLVKSDPTINVCYHRLRSPTDDGNYFVLEALRTYQPSKSEPASEEFLKPVKVEIPAKIPVTKGNPGSMLAKLNFKNDAGKTVTCEYKGNVPKKGPAPTQLAYEFQHCTSKNKIHDTLAAVSIQLQIVNGNSSAGTTAAEISFDYVP